MPACRACGRQFLEWRELLRHVRHRLCAGRPPDKPEIVEVPPVCQRAELIDKWCEHGTSRVASDLGQDGLRKEMLEHCWLCRQWVASSHSIKSHIHRSHRDVYEKQVVSSCQLLQDAGTGVCAGQALRGIHALEREQGEGQDGQPTPRGSFQMHDDGDADKGNSTLRTQGQGEARELWMAAAARGARDGMVERAPLRRSEGREIVAFLVEISN